MSQYILDEKTKLGHDIINDLRQNFARWPRLQASTRPRKCDEAIYEYVLSNDRLGKLSKLTGLRYPHWGDKFYVNTPKGMRIRYVGKDENGDYAPVGVRWASSHDEWSNKALSAPKKIRHMVWNVWRPQIVCTIHPQKLYLKWRKEFMVKNGSGERSRFHQQKIMQTREWINREFEIIPLQFSLRIVERIGREFDGSIESGYAKRSSNIALRENAPRSRHIHDDILLEQKLSPEEMAEMLHKDWDDIEERNEFLRNAHKNFENKYGYGEW